MQTWGIAHGRMPPLLGHSQRRMQQHRQHHAQTCAWQQQTSDAQTLPAAPKIAWQRTLSAVLLTHRSAHQGTCTSHHMRYATKHVTAQPTLQPCMLLQPHTMHLLPPAGYVIRATSSWYARARPLVLGPPHARIPACSLGHQCYEVLVGSRHPLECLCGLRLLALVRVQQASHLLVALLHQGAPRASRHLRW
jgi:hypothetical protein